MKSEWKESNSVAQDPEPRATGCRLRSLLGASSAPTLFRSLRGIRERDAKRWVRGSACPGGQLRAGRKRGPGTERKGVHRPSPSMGSRCSPIPSVRKAEGETLMVWSRVCPRISYVEDLVPNTAMFRGRDLGGDCIMRALTSPVDSSIDKTKSDGKTGGLR